MEVDEASPEWKRRAMKLMAGLKGAKSKIGKKHVSKSKVQKEERRNAGLRA